MADTIDQTTPEAQLVADAAPAPVSPVAETQKPAQAPQQPQQQQNKAAPGRFSQLQRAIPVAAKPVEAPVEVAVQEVVAPVEVAAPIDPRHTAVDAKIKNQEVRQILKSIIEKTPGLYIHFAFLFEYIDKMSAGQRMTEAEGVRQQTALYRAMVGVLKNAEDNHTLGVVALLQIFQEHAEKCFNWDLVNRFIEDHPMPKRDRIAFVGLTTMLTDVCCPDIKERQVRAKRYLSSTNSARLQVAIGEDGLNKLRAALRVN